MPYSDRMQRNHLYSVFLAPRGMVRMADLGVQIAQQYLSPFDQLIGVVGKAGAGKSMLIKGMFPGLELTNDDTGVNVRPLPLFSVAEDNTGFYSPHTYHIDVHFEAAFTQMHVIADAIQEALDLGKRVIVEHFDLIRPFLKTNAHLLMGIGEEVIITRPTLFGPEPEDIANIVFKSLEYRRMAHSAEDLCQFYMKDYVTERYQHSDVRHGFILSFRDKPEIDLDHMEAYVRDMVAQDIPISYLDENHILIGDQKHQCTGPRMHVSSTGKIRHFALNKEFVKEPITGRYLMTGVVGRQAKEKISDLNKIESM